MYRDWRGTVYPADLPQRRWFESYATRFDTVELNATFYRLPTANAVEHWEEQAPPNFVYAAKLGQFGSHRMKLRDAAHVVAEPSRSDVSPRRGARPHTRATASALAA